MLREIAAASEAVVLPPKAIHTAAALEKRGLIKRTWRSSGLPVAVVTADGRYYLKHGKHPREVQAAKERLDEDADEAARAPADGVELISRLLSASGKITVPDPASQTRGRWRAAYYHACTTVTCRRGTGCAGPVGSEATASSHWSTRKPKRRPRFHRCRLSTCPRG
jgi:hypothetical protein